MFGLEVQNEAGQRLTDFAKITHWSQQTPSSNSTRDSSTRGHRQMVNTKINPAISFAAEDGEALYSQQKHELEPTGSYHRLLIVKFRLKLKKVGKITKPFKYDLNQISCDYTVEVISRFKGLDLTDSMPEELWMEVHNIV